MIGLNSGNPLESDFDEGLQVAITFLDAWENQDYNTMYSRLSPNARAAYPQAEFTTIYQNIWEDLGLSQISWARGNVTAQGTTVLFEYTVEFQSATLGPFTDAMRMMRLVPTEEGMRVAWSRMDIFEGWSTGTRLDVRNTVPTRGNIYDRQGRALADQNGIAVQLYLTRNDIPNEDACINELIRLLGREYDDLRALFELYRLDTLFYAGELDQETYQANERILNGTCRPTRVGQRATRRYFGNAAPHVVGYVQRIPADRVAEFQALGYPPDALVGASGIERTFEDELRGTIGTRLALISATDEEIRVITETQPTPGESVYLTLDRDLQAAIQAALAEAYSLAEPTWGQTSRGAAAVVLDVNTGAVLAMVSYPGFDPAVFNPDNPYFDSASIIQGYNSDRRAPLLNRATQGLYPLGSVFKVASSVAAANSGVVPLETVLPCNAQWFGGQFGDSREFRTNWNPQNEGMIDGKMAIIRSCNPYYWQIGVELERYDPFCCPITPVCWAWVCAPGLTA
ncbi:MAG: hypothetical protein HC915_05030 [Anaerolineae bacterium]|nr:hypothetical protein [Anaerolineae bacterium]